MIKVSVKGLQFGDEGKGNIDAYLVRSGRYAGSEGYDAIVRYHGGANAGESWDRGNKIVVSHQVPVCVGEVYAVFLSGGAIHPHNLVKELNYLESEHNLHVKPDMFSISGKNNVVLLHHLKTEEINESGGVMKFGSTKSGISPAYSDAAKKVYINFAEFVGDNFPDILAERIHPQLRRLYGDIPSVEDYVAAYSGIRSRLAPFLQSEANLMTRLNAGNVIMAGCQSIGLDVYQGPTRLTSSSVTTRLPFAADEEIGVMKLIQSEVGKRRWTSKDGRWITYDDRVTKELQGSTDDEGIEVGKTSGRPRGLGYLDLVLVRNNVVVGNITKIAVTKADRIWKVAEILGTDQIPVCTGYRYKREILRTLPEDSYVIEHCEPIYDNWKIGSDMMNPERLRELQTFDELDQVSQDFFEQLGEFAGAEVDIISTGPLSHQKIVRD